MTLSLWPDEKKKERLPEHKLAAMRVRAVLENEIAQLAQRFINESICLPILFAFETVRGDLDDIIVNDSIEMAIGANHNSNKEKKYEDSQPDVNIESKSVDEFHVENGSDYFKINTKKLDLKPGEKVFRIIKNGETIDFREGDSVFTEHGKFGQIEEIEVVITNHPYRKGRIMAIAFTTKI